ncbi:hypothetical protein [Metabacillus fastidiosus]|uniref:hypothetical protein n=1 Tax=Metabacillus fastidiosus TaxID=1458 RepID=UPI003D2BEE15
MYFVIYQSVIAYQIHKFETLDEAQDYVKKLYEKGHREVYLSQEIPMKVKVTVEF